MQKKSNNPKVSILCITYNQEKFIKEALDSLVNQKTDFDFEVIVADDCSTDSTPRIIKEYEEKYPEIINAIYRKSNVGVMKNLSDLFLRAKGKYISLCEGDDFFTATNKIQIQADYLDHNPQYSICFHPVKVFFENKEEKDYIFPQTIDTSKFVIAELLASNFIQTNSVMYRRQAYNNFIQDYIQPYDWYLHLYHAQFGEIGFINKVMSAYRKHPGGIWWNVYKDIDKSLKEYGLHQFELFVELQKIYGDNANYKDIILNNIKYLLDKFIEIDLKDNDSKLLEKALKKFPSQIAEALILLRKRSIHKLNDPEVLELQLKEITSRYNHVINSKQWKFVKKLDLLIPHKLKKYILKMENRKK